MTILDRIIEKKRESLPEIRELARKVKDRTRPCYSLKQRLKEDLNLSVIAEIKRGSPSLGLFAPLLDIQAQALTYQNHGASAISILTDPHFYGELSDLQALAPLLQIPILAKDFIIDPAQIAVAHAAGADVILLIAAVLTPDSVNQLAQAAAERGMEVILELHDADEIPLAAIPEGVILGLNNRNLKTFEVSLQNGLSQIPRLRDTGSYIISESGIHTTAQAEILSKAGFSGMLIGESLIRGGEDSGRLLRNFARIPRR